VVGYLGSEKIISKNNYGQLAGFDEALRIIVDQYPMKDAIIRAGAGGGAGGGGNSQMQGGKRTVSKNDAKALSANVEAIAAGEVLVV